MSHFHEAATEADLPPSHQGEFEPAGPSTTAREKFIEGLREAADFLDAHPGLPTQFGPIACNVFVDTKEEFATFARMGGWAKNANGEWFFLTRTIGSLQYEINIYRRKVCRRVVTGTRDVPAAPAHVIEDVTWNCDEPILAGLDVIEPKAGGL